MQTITYRMDKQQGTTVQHGNYIQYPMIMEKIMKKNMCITESLCCTVEINTTL